MVRPTTKGGNFGCIECGRVYHAVSRFGEWLPVDGLRYEDALKSGKMTGDGTCEPCFRRIRSAIAAEPEQLSLYGREGAKEERRKSRAPRQRWFSMEADAGKEKKILLVGGSRYDLGSKRAAALREEYRIIAAARTESALNLAETHPFDVIRYRIGSVETDVAMDMQAIRRIRELQPRASITVYADEPLPGGYESAVRAADAELVIEPEWLM